MMNWQQFTLSSVQAVMFTSDHSAFVASRVVATIVRRFGEQFDGEMQVLPFPPDVPPEIPRVVLQSSDGSRQVNASPARFNCLWKQSGNAPLRLDETVPQCVEVMEHYVRETRVSIGRLGLVVQRTCPDENPAEALIQRFCNEESRREPFNRSANFEIHNHKEYRPLREGIDYSINSWVRCQCGHVEPERTRSIVVIQDLNTMADDLEKCQFDVDKILGFFSMASEEAETIFRKYFPERERPC